MNGIGIVDGRRRRKARAAFRIKYREQKFERIARRYEHYRALGNESGCRSCAKLLTRVYR